MGVPIVNTFLLVFLGYQILTTSNVSGLPFASIPSMPYLNLSSDDSTNKESSPVSDISNNNDSEKLNRAPTPSRDFKLFISLPNVNIFSLSSQNLPLHTIATNDDISLSPATLNKKYITSPCTSLHLPLSTGAVNSNKTSYSIPMSTPTFFISPSLDQELKLNLNVDDTAKFLRAKDLRDTRPVSSRGPSLSYRLVDCDSSTALNSPPRLPQLSRSNSDVSCIIDSPCSNSKPVLPSQNQLVSSINNNNCDSQVLDTSTYATSDGEDTNTLQCLLTKSNRQISFLKKTTSVTNDCSSNKAPSPVFFTLNQLNNNQTAKFFNIDDLMAFSSSFSNTPSVNLLKGFNVNNMDITQSKSQLNIVDSTQEVISSCNCPSTSPNLCQNNNFFNNFNVRRNLGQLQIETNDVPNLYTETDCNLVNSQSNLLLNANKAYFQNFRVGCEQLNNNNAPPNVNQNNCKPIQINVENNMTPLSNNNLIPTPINPSPSLRNLNNNNNNHGCPQLKTIEGSNCMPSLAPNNIIINTANDLTKQNICGNNLGCPQIIPTNNKIANNFIINGNPKFVSLPTQNQNCPQVISVPANSKNILQTKSIELTKDNEKDCIQNNNIDISSTNQGVQSEPFLSVSDMLVQPNFGLNLKNNNVVSNQNDQCCSELLTIAKNNLMAMLNAKAKPEANNQCNSKMCLNNNLQSSSLNLESDFETSPVLEISQGILKLKDVSKVVPAAAIKSLVVQPNTQNNIGPCLTPRTTNSFSLCNNDVSVPSVSLLNLTPSLSNINIPGSIVSTEIPYLNQPNIYYPNSFTNTNLETILTFLQSNINNNLQDNYKCIQSGIGNSPVSSNTIPIQSLPQVSFVNSMPSPTITIPFSVALPETVIPNVSNLPLVCTTPTPYTSIHPIITSSSSASPIMSPLLPQTNNVGNPEYYTSLKNLVSSLTQNIISNLISNAVPVAQLPLVNTIAPMIISESTPIDSLSFDVTEPLSPYFIAAPQSSPKHSFSNVPVACNEYLPPVGCSQFLPLFNSDLFGSASEPDIFECLPFALSATDAFYPEISFLMPTLESQEFYLPVRSSSAKQQSPSVSKINNAGTEAKDIQRLIASLSQGC